MRVDTKKKTLLIIAPLNSLHSYRWINRISLNNVKIILLNSDLETLERKYPYKVYSLNEIGLNKRSKLNYFKNILNVRKFMREINPDLIHIHWIYSQISLLVSILHTCRILLTPWGSDLLIESRKEKSKFGKLKQLLVIQLVISKADAICSDALHLEAKIRKFLHKKKLISRIIYFGTDTNKFDKNKFSHEFRNNLGISPENLLVLSNRGLASVYDIDTFIRAAAIAAIANPRLKFVVAGGGAERERLEALSNKLGLRSVLQFTGRLSDDNFAILTASCDIYVSTSTSDGGIAASVAEAMSCSKPVIITEFGENKSWINGHGEAGMLFPIGDEVKLSECILKLADELSLRRSMGEIGRSVIEKYNNAEIEAKKADKFYREILGIV